MHRKFDSSDFLGKFSIFFTTKHAGTMLVFGKLTPKKKTGRGRKSLLPSVKDFCRLCGCSFKVQYGESAHIKYRNSKFISSI
jgi:hypothetical protein